CTCGQAIWVPESFAGRFVKCGACGRRILAPQAGTPNGGESAPGPIETAVTEQAGLVATAVPKSELRETAAALSGLAGEALPQLAPLVPAATLEPAFDLRPSGYTPHRRQVADMRNLATGLVLVALVTAAPATYVWCQEAVVRGVLAACDRSAMWMMLSFLVSVLQLAYAVYVWQLPDWSSAWVVAVFLLGMTVCDAMVLGMSYASRTDSWFVEQLQVADQLRRGQVSGWSFIMMCVSSMLSYFSFRASVRWRQALSE
ncbi:MAG: hypothetical protein AB7O38_21580, partial [Pirellulaceae bacterium]